MAFDQEPVTMFGCTFCPLVFPTNSDKNAHTLGHFQQKHCDGCNQSLIYVADVWYQVHLNENCTIIKDEIGYRPIEFQSVNLNEYIDVPMAYEQQVLNENNEQCEIKIEKELLCEPLELNVLADMRPEDTQQPQIQNQKNSKQCNFCGATYLSSSNLLRHKRFKHRDEILADCPFICDICSLHFKKEFHYRKHLLEKHGIDKVPEENQSESGDKNLCTTASSINKKKEENQSENITNISNSELDDSLLLGDDDLSSLAMDILIDDIKLNQDDDSFVEDAIELASEIEDQSNHSLAKESSNASAAVIGKKRCDLCSATYATTSSLHRHKRHAHKKECLKESNFMCNICVSPFKVEYFYVKHMRDKHDTEIGIQLDSAQTEQSINQSEQSDLEANAESDAGRSTSNVDNHSKRTITMNDPTIAYCNLCPAEYKSLNSLSRHRRIAHSDELKDVRKFECDICKQRFVYKHFLLGHMLRKHRHGNVNKLNDSQTIQCPLPMRTLTMTDPTILCCNFCPAKYKTHSSLSRHRRIAHSEELKDVRKFECDICKQRFGHKHFLLRHMLRKHRLGNVNKLNDLQTIQCPFCELRFQSLSTLLKHKRKNHKERLVADGWPLCKFCDLPFETEKYLERHMVEKHDVSETENYYGETIFHDEHGNEIQSNQNLQESPIMNIPLGKIKLKRTQFACTLCSSVFNQREELVRHRFQKHHKTTICTTQNTQVPKKYSCPYCPRSYDIMTSFCRHKRTAHADRRKLLDCELCSKKFKVKQKLRQHMFEDHDAAFDPSIRRFTCYKCSSTHRTPGLLVFHLKKHADIEYKCCIDQCIDRFDTLDELHKHLLDHDRKHQEEYKRKCDKCKRIFTPWTFEGHNCVEQVQRKHMCDYCGKMFRFRDALAAHINIHTGNRPYKCTFCDKSFKNKNGKKSHMLTHTNEKPIKCKVDGCNEAFKIHKQLHLHEFSAHGIHRRTHQCTVCDRVFPEKVWLRNHLKTHGIVMASNSTST